MPGLLDEFPTVKLLGLDLVAAELPAVAASLAARSGLERFSYVVTPNADHFVRLRRDLGELMELYRAAGSLHLDSRVVRGIGKMLQLPVPPVVAGSDLTLELLERWIDPGEPITVVGTTSAAVERLSARYRLSRCGSSPFALRLPRLRSAATGDPGTPRLPARPSKRDWALHRRRSRPDRRS
jgi:N-acetylglucosaminyldiphosphoundecaprenol N-acetyl-beta-D-mannosaminyltransferase